MTTIAASRPIVIGDEDIRRYREDGAICLRGLIDEVWLGRLRAATEAALAAGTMDMSKKGQSGKFLGDINLWTKNQSFYGFRVGRTFLADRQGADGFECFAPFL